MKEVEIVANKIMQKDMAVQFSIFFTIVMTLIFGISYYFFNQTLIEREYENRYNTITAIVDNLDSSFAVIENTMVVVSNYEDIIIGLWTEDGHNYKENLRRIRNTSSLLSSVVVNNLDIEDIMVINNKGYVYESYSSIYFQNRIIDEMWFPDITMTGNEIIYVHTNEIVGEITFEYKNDYIVAIKPVWYIFSDDPIGYLISMVNANNFRKILDSAISDEDAYFVRDKSGRVKMMSENINPELVTQELQNRSINKLLGIDYLVVIEKSEITDWEIVCLTPLSSVSGNLSFYAIIFAFIYIIVICIIVFITWIMSQKITKPIKKLVNHMSEQDAEELKEIVIDSHYKEINTLTSNFNDMVSRNRLLINGKYKLEIQNKEAQVRALQRRINPHFLFNALQSIQSLAVLKRTEDIKQLLTDLGYLFRYIIYDTESHATLKSECIHLKAYINFQVKWFNKNCIFSFDVPESIMEIEVPKLILQPIAENIFRHGLKTSKGLHVDVSGWIEENTAIISISDTGVGISEEKLNSIIEEINNPKENVDNGHIGLRNVNRRLKLKFGAEYGISLDSCNGLYTKVYIRVPYPL